MNDEHEFELDDYRDYDDDRDYDYTSRNKGNEYYNPFNENN